MIFDWHRDEVNIKLKQIKNKYSQMLNPEFRREGECRGMSENLERSGNLEETPKGIIKRCPDGGPDDFYWMTDISPLGDIKRDKLSS